MHQRPNLVYQKTWNVRSLFVLSIFVLFQSMRCCSEVHNQCAGFHSERMSTSITLDHVLTSCAKLDLLWEIRAEIKNNAQHCLFSRSSTYRNSLTTSIFPNSTIFSCSHSLWTNLSCNPFMVIVLPLPYKISCFFRWEFIHRNANRINLKRLTTDNVTEEVLFSKDYFLIIVNRQEYFYFRILE